MKTSRYLSSLLLMLLLFLMACQEEEISIPLSGEKMVEVLVDIHIAEAMLDKLLSTDQDTVGKVYYRMIFREHDISEQDFDESISVLREDPKRLNAIYVQVLEKLTVLDAAEREPEKME